VIWHPFLGDLNQSEKLSEILSGNFDAVWQSPIWQNLI